MFLRLVRQLLIDHLPRHCVLCTCIIEKKGIHLHAHDIDLCDFCSSQFFHQHTLRCTVCANKLNHQHIAQHCAKCLTQPPAFDMTRVVTDYVAPYNTLIHSLKFQHQLALAPLFAYLLAQTWQQTIRTKADFIIPIPLSAQRLSERGFNQSLEIAKPLAQHLQLPLLPSLAFRIRHTQAQSSLAFKKRKNNLRGAFIIPNSSGTLKNKHIIVVDDVMTSGHTVNEFAACLKRHGAARVTNLVFARTIAH
jgi:ComF family protein